MTRRPALLFGIWIATCGAALAALWSVDDPRFMAPPIDPERWSTWASGRDGLDAVAAVSRVISTAALVYLVVVAGLHLGALLWGPSRLRRITARLNPTPIAGLAAAAVLGASPVAGAVDGPAGDGDPAQPTPTMRLIEEDGSPSTTANSTTVRSTTAPTSVAPTTTASASTTAPTTTTAQPHTTTPPRDGPARSRSSVAAESGRDGQGADQLVVTVEPGDHLWGIAERRVRLAIGTDPAPEVVGPYWKALIEANRDRLVEPDNPDLILPGQELVLPG